MKKFLISSIILLAMVTKSFASPALPAPLPDGSSYSINIVFDGFMGCIPMFHIEFIRQP